MKKILISQIGTTFGGIETFIYNVIKNIDRDEYDITVLMNGDSDEVKNKFLSTGADVINVPSKIKYINFINKLLKNNKYDIVHVNKNSAADIVLPLIVKKYKDSKLIIHSHNSRPSTNSKLVSILHNINKPILNRIADKKLACSDLAANWLFDKNISDVTIIKNGIHSNLYIYNKEIRNKIRKELNLKEIDYVVGNVGGFREQKNHIFLLETFKDLKDKNLKLLLIGEGKLLEQYRQYVEQNNLSNNVIFLGARDNVNELLMSMDLFVMPSLYEGLPFAAIEAQASGLPLLLSDTITKEIDITGNVKFLDINNKNPWIEEIEKRITIKNREIYQKNIIAAGYDIKSSVKILEKIYKTI